MVQWVCQVIPVCSKCLFVLPFLGEAKCKNMFFSERSQLNSGKLHESFRNLLDWGICQLKGRQSCCVWLLFFFFFSAEGSTFKPSQRFIFHYLSPNRIAHLLQLFLIDSLLLESS